MLTPLLANAQASQQLELLTLAQFVKALLQPSDTDMLLQGAQLAHVTEHMRLRALGMSLEEFPEYVALMLNPGSENPSSSSSAFPEGDGHGGVLVSASPDGKLSFAFYDSDTELAQLRQFALNTLAQPTHQEPPLTNGAAVIGENRQTGRDPGTTKRKR